MKKLVVILFVSYLFPMYYEAPSLIDLAFSVCKEKDLFDSGCIDLFCQVGLRLYKKKSLGDGEISQLSNVILICEACKKGLTIGNIAQQTIDKMHKKFAEQIENNKVNLQAGFCRTLINKFESH